VSENNRTETENKR